MSKPQARSNTFVLTGHLQLNYTLSVGVNFLDLMHKCSLYMDIAGGFSGRWRISRLNKCEKWFWRGYRIRLKWGGWKLKGGSFLKVNQTKSWADYRMRSSNLKKKWKSEKNHSDSASEFMASFEYQSYERGEIHKESATEPPPKISGP